MSVQIVVDVPDRLYHHLVRLAKSSGRNVADLVASMMSVSFMPLSIPDSDTPLEHISDEEVMTLAESQMNPTQNERMTELLDKKQAGEISGSERDELSVLVYIYEQGSILKAKALHEAIRRGLHQPVNA